METKYPRRIRCANRETTQMPVDGGELREVRQVRRFRPRLEESWKRLTIFRQARSCRRMAPHEGGSGIGDEGRAGEPHGGAKTFDDCPRQTALIMANMDRQASQRVATADQEGRARIGYA